MKLTNNEKDKFTYNTLSFVISVVFSITEKRNYVIRQNSYFHMR